MSPPDIHRLPRFLTARYSDDEQLALAEGIVRIHRPLGFDCGCCGYEYPCETLRLLAWPYRDHPDWQTEWKALP